MINFFSLITLLFVFQINLWSQTIAYNSKDTIIVGKLIDTDSITIEANSGYSGIKYYYGVHHIKIAVIDIRNKNFIDTLIVSIVYNMVSEKKAYRNNFGLKKDATYAFHVHSFTPCKSDFPRIQGGCSTDSSTFYPKSGKLVKSYDSILRIILFYPYKY